MGLIFWFGAFTAFCEHFLLVLGIVLAIVDMTDDAHRSRGSPRLARSSRGDIGGSGLLGYQYTATHTRTDNGPLF